MSGDGVGYIPPDLSGYMTTDSANVTIAQMTADIQAAKNAVKALPNVTAAGQILLSALAGPRKHTLACVGAVAGDRLYITPVATMPAGYMLGDVFCPANDSIEVSVYLPTVALLTNYSIALKVTALRPV